MYRFSQITTLAPLFSVMPFGAWLMLVAGTVIGIIFAPTSLRPQASQKR